jgi:uncharacterized sulfatase
MNGNAALAYPWGDGVVVNTPNIDKLAKQGAIFENFYAATPLCTPSRSSFQTGLYPIKTGAWKNQGYLKKTLKTFADILREKRGYSTAYMGKWHLDGTKTPGWANDDPLRNFGYADQQYKYNRGHWKYFEENPQRTKTSEYDFNTGEEIFQGSTKDHYATDFLFDRAIEYIEKQKRRDEEFAIMISISDPHSPNFVRKPYTTMYDYYDFKDIPKTAVRALRRNPALPEWAAVPTDLTTVDSHLDKLRSDDFRIRYLRTYFAMVKLIDDNLGKLVDYLESASMRENTIIVFTSDHGDLLGEHARQNKGMPYETSSGVPMIVSYPGRVVPGKHVKSVYSNTDFMPSILSLMGIDDLGVEVDGINFAPELLNSELQTSTKTIRFLSDSKKSRWAAAVTLRYKLVFSSRDHPWLFDLKEDPDELNNYFNEPGYEDIQKELSDALIKEMLAHSFPLLAFNNIVLFDKPACYDRKSIVPNESDSFTCKQMDKSNCSKNKFANWCPVTCKTCCEDSSGKLYFKGDILTCKDLKALYQSGKTNVCNAADTRKFCPVTCGACGEVNDDDNVFDDDADGKTDDGNMNDDKVDDKYQNDSSAKKTTSVESHFQV